MGITAGTTLRLLVAGSPDFVLRIGAALRNPDNSFGQVIIVTSSSLAELRSVALTERPDIIVVDIGIRMTSRDALWLKAILRQLRDRQQDGLYVIAAATTPTHFAFAGELLFGEEDLLQPSGLIDNMLVSPPSGFPDAMSLEKQLLNCLEHVLNIAQEDESSVKFPLPPLWNNGWVPIMCDPESRDVWMRWLPRYALYVTENPLIVGPTGSGKTRLAYAIHQLSGRSGPFVTITPRDFSSTELVQAELFGAVAGAYTGAVEKWGLVKKADKGTLFIDELQSIDRDLQGKLITFIEDKSYRRVGEAESHRADVRFVFATNRSLHELVEEGSLRDDFAYRLERLQIVLSPLHNRPLDIGAGICFALARVLRERTIAMRSSTSRASQLTSTPTIQGLTQDAYQVLFSSIWPGNFRQLENSVAKLVELADLNNLNLIDTSCTGTGLKGMLGKVERTMADVYEKAVIGAALQARVSGFADLDDLLTSVSNSVRQGAVNLAAGDLERAAKLLGEPRQLLELFVSAWRADTE